MPEADEQLAKPLRTWRPMILWTLGILAVLGLAWFVGAVVVPTVRTDRILRELDYRRTQSKPWPTWDGQAENATLERLGGADKAFGPLKVYRALPRKVAPHRAAALRLLGLCGPRALPLMDEAIASSDGAEVLLALSTLQEKFEGHTEVAALAPTLTRLLDVDRPEEPWPEVPRMAERIICWTGPANVVFRAEGESAEILDSQQVAVEAEAGLALYLGALRSEGGASEYPRTMSGGKALHFDSVSGVLRGKPLARLRFAVPESGSYYIFLRGDAWCCGCQFLEFRIDDGDRLSSTELWFGNSLDWRSLVQEASAAKADGARVWRPGPVRFSAGEHSVTITGAEPICGGMIVDELAVVRSGRAGAGAPKKTGGEEPPK